MNGRPSARIGVDFHVFDSKFQGSRSHLIGVFGELVGLRPDYQFYFLLEDTEGLSSMPAFQRENVNMVRMPWANPLVRLGWQLPRLKRQLCLDLLHTQYIMPFWGTKGSAVTVHDVLYESHPQFFRPTFVLRSKLLVRRSALKADLLFTVSEYSRSEISRRYGIPASAIAVLQNAVDGTRFHAGLEPGHPILERRGLVAGRYMLTVGRIEPRKNHATLVRAYGDMKGSPPPLVVVGQRDFGYGEFDAAAGLLPESHRLHVFDDVGDDELPVLFRNALLFAYPSHAEGFGMPPLEAMASGVPVIASRGTAIAEVLGDAAILVDPQDVHGIRAALESLCAEESLRTSLVAQGLEQASLFDWKSSARTLASGYDTYLRRHSVEAGRAAVNPQWKGGE